MLDFLHAHPAHMLKAWPMLAATAVLTMRALKAVSTPCILKATVLVVAVAVLKHCFINCKIACQAWPPDMAPYSCFAIVAFSLASLDKTPTAGTSEHLPACIAACCAHLLDQLPIGEPIAPACAQRDLLLCLDSTLLFWTAVSFASAHLLLLLADRRIPG